MVLSTTVPGAFITCVITGVPVILVMRMSRDADRQPSTGSFADLARTALGGWAGFLAGWLY